MDTELKDEILEMIKQLEPIEQSVMRIQRTDALDEMAPDNLQFDVGATFLTEAIAKFREYIVAAEKE